MSAPSLSGKSPSCAKRLLNSDWPCLNPFPWRFLRTQTTADLIIEKPIAQISKARKRFVVTENFQQRTVKILEVELSFYQL